MSFDAAPFHAAQADLRARMEQAAATGDPQAIDSVIREALGLVMDMHQNIVELFGNGLIEHEKRIAALEKGQTQ